MSPALSYIPAFLSGFALGFSLILAIGAQNAFVLKQGLKKQHVFLVCLSCAASDALLISLGVLGFGVIVEQFPAIITVARYGGALFLAVYGSISLYSAIKKSHALAPAGEKAETAAKALITCLAFTWLNPHVYLDTVILLGSVSTQYAPYTFAFGAGAAIASFVFFFTLGYGAKLFTAAFQKPAAWKVLDFFIALIMFALAASLVLNDLS